MQRIGADRRKLIIRIILELIPIMVIAGLIACDQLSKNYFENVNSLQNYPVIDGFFYFDLNHNTGAAWSFLADKPWSQTFFKVLTIIALAGFIFVYVYSTIKNQKWLKWSMVLIISGAVGNFIDRCIYGYVVDFLSFIFGEYAFPVFNLADSFLVIGVIVAFANFLFFDENAIFSKKKNKQGEEVDGEEDHSSDELGDKS